MRNYIALAILFLTGTLAHGSELAVLEAGSFDVGGYHGIAYYTSEADGYRVVATIALGETGLPVRFEAVLTETQAIRISVPGKLREMSDVLEISRVNGKLVIALVEPAVNAMEVAAP